MIGEADADLILLDDGGDHTEDTNTIDYYEIYDGPASDPTTVTFNTGAVVNGFNLDDQSVYIADTSELLINDGIFSEDVTVCGMASGEIHGGTFQDDLNAESSGIILFYGGLVIDDVEAVGSSRIDIFGGSFGEDIEASGDARINISGGLFAQGGNDPFPGFYVDTGGKITITGLSFQIDAVPTGAGLVSDEFGQLTGLLADGSALDVLFDRNPMISPDPADWGNIELVVVPEPSAATFLAIAGLLLVRRRR